MYACVGNVRLLLYLSYHVIPFIPSGKAALVSPLAAAVQLPDNSNDDDDDDGPTSFTNDRMAFTFEYLFGNLVGNLVTTGITPNPRIDVVHNAITGNADVGTETTVLPHYASNREQLPHDTSKERYSYTTVDAHSHKGGQ